MNLDEALQKLQEGEKVKLPEWTGYWFVPEGYASANIKDSVHVLCKNGDKLSTPWFDKYKDRTDFEVADGSLGYDFALLAMENGKLLARRGWNGAAMFGFMRPADRLPIGFVRETIKSLPQSVRDYFKKWSGGDTHYSNGDEIMVEFGAYLCLKTAQNTIANGWQPSQTDMLAKDWFVVE